MPGGGDEPRPREWWEPQTREEELYYRVQETKNILTQHQHNRAVLKLEEFERLQPKCLGNDPRTWARPPAADARE